MYQKIWMKKKKANLFQSECTVHSPLYIIVQLIYSFSGEIKTISFYFIHLVYHRPQSMKDGHGCDTDSLVCTALATALHYILFSFWILYLTRRWTCELWIQYQIPRNIGTCIKMDCSNKCSLILSNIEIKSICRSDHSQSELENWQNTL